MKNIFQNQSIKKAAAAGMIAAQVSIGSNFLSNSFVDSAFAETGFYNAWNSSIFNDLVPNYSVSNLDVDGISNTETQAEKTRCVLDSDINININPKAYSIDSNYENINDKIKLDGQVGFANKIEYSALPSLEGIFTGLASSTYSYGPNYNSNVSVSVNLTSDNPGLINQLTSDSFDYTPDPAPTTDYATGTYLATNGLGDTVNGVFVYNNYISAKYVEPLNVNYNSLSPLVAYQVDVMTDVVQNPVNGTIVNNSGVYYYQPNPGYTGQDFFTIRTTDFYVAVLKQNPTNGFEGGNFFLNSGVSEYSSIRPLGHFRFYKPNLFTSLQNFYGALLYKLSAPTSTIPLPQLLSNGSSTSFIIDTMSSFYNDYFKVPSFQFSKQFTVVVEHDNKAPVVIPTAPASFIISNSTGTVTLTSDYKDLEGDNFDLIYEVSNDNFATVLNSTTTNIAVPGINSTSSNSVSFDNLSIGNYSYRVKAVELGTTQNCIGYTDQSGFKIASSTSVIKNFIISSAPLPVSVPPRILPTASSTFVIPNATGSIELSSLYNDLEGDTFDYFYEVYLNDATQTQVISEVFEIIDPLPNATSSFVASYDLSIGDYIYRVRAEEYITPTKNGGLPASSTSAFRQFTVTNLPITPTSTSPEIAPSTPQGGLLPLILISPIPTIVAPTTTPTTTVPVKEVLGLNPEDSDEILPGESIAAYTIRMEKRKVLGRSGIKTGLENTGSNNVLKIFAGVTLLAGVMLLLKNRQDRKEKKSEIA